MKSILATLKDRKRSQRGSVLSGVLIITAFLAIISGALMTELSTNFLLSSNLVTKVANEASINSAVELAISQLQDTQTTPINQRCPALSNVTLNGRTVVPSYASCWPTVSQTEPQFARLTGSSMAAFTVDGAHAQIGALNDYVVGNSGGTVFDYPFGATIPRWTLPLRGTMTAPPLVMRSPGGSAYLDLIPLSGPDCSLPNNPYVYCLNVRLDTGSTYTPPLAPVRSCVLGTARAVATRPAASTTFAGVIYYADSSTLYATDVGGAVGGCDVEGSSTSAMGLPVVAGPIAFNFGRYTDYVYAVLSDGSSSRLIRCSYGSGLSCTASPLALPWANAVGLAASSAGLPATVAITFRDGGVALVRIDSNGTPSLVISRLTGGVIADAPYWCTPAQCAADAIGVATSSGPYLYNSSLSPLGPYTGPGFGSTTTPVPDSAGNWYFAANDGYVHELQLQSGQLNQVNSYGSMGPIGSSPQIGGCQIGRQSGICIYLGAVNRNAYLVPLDARDAVISACISSSPPSCRSGTNGRLKATLEVGSSSSPQTVRVQGWSYYSG